MNFVTSDEVHIAYRVDGPDNAPTITMSNSLGTNLHMWDLQVGVLSKNFRIIRYDSRGHGASDAPAGPYTIERLGLDLLELLDTLHIERTHICGLSLGGIVALWFAANHPGRVDRAIFANTAARIGSVEMWNARIDAVRTGGMEAIRDAILARFLSEKYRHSHPEVVHQIGEMLVAINPNGYISVCEALREADLRHVLSSIHSPSLILVGALDEATPPSQSQELHAVIANSKLLIFPEVAHLSNIEQSEAFNNALLAFFARS
jgi:3-oxoadipate enol-lactonase